RNDPNSRNYMDLALTPVAADDFDSFEMYAANEAAKSTVVKIRGQAQGRAADKNTLVKIG
ncbi:MAG: hypothetical protein M3Z36_05850, partial [Acidobacteriota bacterium]|nr:hypothetical protein [Acidobacteriota bacterium]